MNGWGRRLRRSACVGLTAALPLLFLVPSACSPGNPKRRAAPRVFPKAPVILISIDTLRSDRLPFYGYGGVETPALSALRADSILFENAWAHVPLTLPSHAALFTGLLPDRNGVRDNLGYSVNPGVPTLAELLRKAGYATGGVVTSRVLNGNSGIGRGFDLWDDDIYASRSFQGFGTVQRPGDDAVESMKAWIEEQGDRPFFAFLHLFEPHSPYEPVEPFRSRYPDPYDGEIATADAITGRFLDFLRAKGLYDRALVILLSDHGEGLGDHGEDEHGLFLYREVLQVPLLVKLPGGEVLAGASVPAPVQLSDVFTTVGQGVGLSGFVPPAGTVSIIDVADGIALPDRRIYAETYFPRLHFGWSELRALLDERWHYIEAPRPEFFDLKSDPGQKVNLADRKPDAFRAMRIEMERLRTSFSPPSAVDAETAKQLASLGYISSGATAGDGPLDDPKDHVETVRLMKAALHQFDEGKPEITLAIAGKLLEENPRMLDIWELKAQALAKLGRTDEALSALRKTVELSPPGSTQYVRSTANHCLQMGKFEEGKRHAELAKRMGDPAADEILARACLALGDLNGAEAAALASLRSETNRPRGYLTLARVEVQRRDFAKALAFSDKALPRSPRSIPPAGLHQLRGDVFARTDRFEEAEAEFKEETRLFPSSLDAWSSLVVLYLAQNRRPDARRTVERMIAANRDVGAYLQAIRALAIAGDREGAEHWQREGLRRFPQETRLRRIPRPA